jgi:undecaprenyl-diphosphatase
VSIIQLIYSVILGIVQGISEWLPISSKTQILAASTYLLNLNFQQAYTFGLFMEIGTVAAAIIYFRNDIAALISVLLGSKDRMRRRLFKYVLVTTVITGIIGVPLYLVADSVTGVTVGIPMLIIGFVLIGDALFIRHSRKKRSERAAKPRKFADLTFKEYVVIGIMQGIAALPGVSRSGITTSAMLVMDVEADEAFRLSFLIGIFATAAAFGVTLVFSNANVSAALAGIGVAGLAVAIVTATIVSLFLIDFLIKVASKSKIVYLTAALGAIAIGSGLLYLLFSV